jgi:hypothetical protein
MFCRREVFRQVRERRVHRRARPLRVPAAAAAVTWPQDVAEARTLAHRRRLAYRTFTRPRR